MAVSLTLAAAVMGGAFRAEAELEAARAALAMLVGTAGVPTGIVGDEVARREAMFAEARRRSPREGEHPRLAALRSVFADVAAGRLS